ncbi:hypothetical protein ACFPRL_32755 [Pseudoclavibacter helvolus]
MRSERVGLAPNSSGRERQSIPVSPFRVDVRLCPMPEPDRELEQERARVERCACEGLANGRVVGVAVTPIGGSDDHSLAVRIPDELVRRCRDLGDGIRERTIP